MLLPEQWSGRIAQGALDRLFSQWYPGRSAQACRARYIGALAAFERRFGARPAAIVTAPGRTEIGGNHTDHQRGRVLAAAVDLDILCIAAPNRENVIRVLSEGHPAEEVDLTRLRPVQAERERAGALIRGVAAWFSEHGYPVGGFDACTTSDVLSGSGLSSSAAFEVSLGNILGALYPGGAGAVDMALAGQYAENEFFGKPSGLMDQMASSVGGFVQIDFQNPQHPKIDPVAFDLADSGYHLCIVDTGGSHADLTGEYAAIFEEMRAVSRFFGKQVLREVDPDRFRGCIAELRAAVGDRAVLRAVHFFADNDLVPQMARALAGGDFPAFLEMSTRSGRSSFTCLQNVFAVSNPREQGLALALALSEAVLAGRGAWRGHGGGFAGTIQAFVPDDLLGDYRSRLEAVFGPGSCHVLSVRAQGGAVLHEPPDQEGR